MQINKKNKNPRQFLKKNISLTIRGFRYEYTSFANTNNEFFANLFQNRRRNEIRTKKRTAAFRAAKIQFFAKTKRTFFGFLTN